MSQDITVSPGSVNFGDVTVGTTASQTVTVTNDGTAPLTIGQVSALTGAFSIVTDGCSTLVLAPTDSCDIDIEFTPTATGSASDSFDIPSDDPDEDPVTVSVSGNGATESPFRASNNGSALDLWTLLVLGLGGLAAKLRRSRARPIR